MEAPRSPTLPFTTVAGAARPVASLKEQRYRLVVTKGPQPGLSFELGESPVQVGKAPDNQVVIDDPTVSRAHFALRRDGERFVLQDLGSTNGTYLDGVQVREAYLRPGALIEAGDVELRFQPEQAPLALEPSAKERFGSVVGKSLAMRQIFALLERVSPTDATVLLVGETGTGKGAVARAIHEASPRSAGPFVVVDCGAIADTLIESELFGHERGAFTGAMSARAGSLELAGGGTLFLDEIDDLALELQPKLLRALDERVFQRVGSSTPMGFDARILATSKKDLWAQVQAGKFREDLFFRLSVFAIRLPSLRERVEDIPGLVEALGGAGLWDGLPPELRERFSAHPWPGNVRELRNAIERARHLSSLPDLEPALPSAPPAPAAPPASASPGDAAAADFASPFKEAKEKVLAAFEREYLRRLLERAEGNIARAAREAQLDRKHLYSLLKKHGLSPSMAGESKEPDEAGG